jgi:hypothetical protein
LLVAPIKIARHPIVIALFVAFGAPISGKANKIDDYVVAQMQRLHKTPSNPREIFRDR